MVRNIVVVCLDTVRKDYFDEYATRLQDESDGTFEQCRAASSWTTPSHGSMFTGTLPHQHHIHTHDRRFDKLSHDDTFFSELSKDYTTIAVSTNVHAGPAFGFDTLFDHFLSITPHNYFSDGLDLKTFLNECEEDGLELYKEWVKTAVRHENPVKSLANGVITKLDSLSRNLPFPKPIDDGAKRAIRHTNNSIDNIEEPFFVFMNLMDAHPPLQHTRGYNGTLHDVPNSWSSLQFDYWEIRRDGAIEKNRENIANFKGIYRAAIDYLDRIVTDFISDLHERTDNETTVIVTSDHGEDLGGLPSNPSFGHTGSLTEGLLHVPLELFNTPDHYPKTENGFVSHLDLGRLVTHIADDECVDITRDSIPAELIGGLRTDQEWPLSDSEFKYWNRMIRCAYRDDAKIVWDSQGHISKHRIDPKRSSWEEKPNKLESVPAWASGFFEDDVSKYKKQALEIESSFDRIDDATLDQLEELGYI